MTLCDSTINQFESLRRLTSALNLMTTCTIPLWQTIITTGIYKTRRPGCLCTFIVELPSILMNSDQ